MNFVRDRVGMDLPQFYLRNFGLRDFDFNFNGRERVHHSMELAKQICLCVAEIALRLPGLILLELWWRKRDMTFDEMTEGLLEKAQFHSYLDIENLLDFVHRRNIEESAAAILSCSVFLLSLTFLTLNLELLLRLYAHAFSLLCFGLAHYMSMTYVALEERSTEAVLKLDGFVKLERHGFHFLAQLMLSVLQSMLLGLESDVGRVCLAVYTLPMIARLCSCPLDKLIVVHNVSCSLTMMAICVYTLHKVPRIYESVLEGVTWTRSLLATRGLAVGAATVWRRIRLTELLTWAWLTMFALRCYHEMVEKGRSWRETWPVILEGIAETTNTPLTMLALALTVSCVCHWALYAAQWFIAAHNWQPQHVLAHSGYMECVLLVLVCTQTGLLGMKNEQKAALLGLILFIVLSALLHSLLDIVEGQLQILATARDHPRSKHARAVCFAAFLAVAPIITASTAHAYLPMDLWLCILHSNCFITTVHAASAIIQYAIARAEARAETWTMADTAAFITTLLTKILEIGCTMLVIAVGSYVTVVGEWTVASIGILLLQVVFNVVQKIDVLFDLFQKRHEAQANLERLPVASEAQIREHADICAICLQDMDSAAQIRITPCSHLFHSPCLKKWLAVKQVCPLCYADLSLPKPTASSSSREGSINGGDARENRRHAHWRDGAEAAPAELELDRLERMLLNDRRDVWPLVGLNYDSEDFEEDSDDAASDATGSVASSSSSP